MALDFQIFVVVLGSSPTNLFFFLFLFFCFFLLAKFCLNNFAIEGLIRFGYNY